MSATDGDEGKDLPSAAADALKNALVSGRKRKEKFRKKRGLKPEPPRGEIEIGTPATPAASPGGIDPVPYRLRRSTGLLTGPDESDDDESNDEWEEHVEVDERTVAISVSAAVAAAEARNARARHAARVEANARERSSTAGAGASSQTREEQAKAEKKRVLSEKREARASVARQYGAHVVLLLAVLGGLDAAADDEELQALALSEVPEDVLEHGGGLSAEGLGRFTLWFCFTFRRVAMFRASRPRRPCSARERARLALRRECGHVLDLAVLAAAMLRACGARCRIIVPLQPTVPEVPQRRSADGITRTVAKKTQPMHDPGFYAWLEVWSGEQDAWLPVDFCAGTVDVEDSAEVVGNVRNYAMDMYHKTPEHGRDKANEQQSTPARFRIQEIEKAIGRIDHAFLAYTVAVEDAVYTDVTRRYVESWNEVIKRRGKGRVLERVIDDVSRHPEGEAEMHSLKKEAEFFDEIASHDEMPATIAACYKHPRYVLERHLKKYEILHPRRPVVGHVKGEPIFLRSRVKQLHSKDRWIRKMRQVKPNVKPVKHVKAVMSRDSGNQIALFGEWQTVPLVIEECKDGKVPRNERGQVDLWSEEHLPKGAAHVDNRFAASVASSLGFDFAPAMTGFELRRGRSVPKFDGIVIAQENAAVVMDAAREKEREAWKRAEKIARQEEERRRRQLRKAEAIKEKVRKKYGGMIEDDGTYEATEKRKGIKRAREEKAKDKGGGPSTKRPSPDRGSSSRRPPAAYRSETHEHKYVNRREMEDGQWVKTCSECGIDVVYEKL